MVIKKNSLVCPKFDLKTGYKSDVIPAGSIGVVFKKTKHNKLHIHFKEYHSTVIASIDSVHLVETYKQIPNPGDIFAANWGYEQTQTNWFKLLKVNESGTTGTFIAVNESRSYDGYLCGKATVIPSDEIGIPFKKKINYKIDGIPFFKFSSYANAYYANPSSYTRTFTEYH